MKARVVTPSGFRARRRFLGAQSSSRWGGGRPAWACLTIVLGSWLTGCGASAPSDTAPPSFAGSESEQRTHGVELTVDMVERAKVVLRSDPLLGPLWPEIVAAAEGAAGTPTNPTGVLFTLEFARAVTIPAGVPMTSGHGEGKPFVIRPSTEPFTARYVNVVVDLVSSTVAQVSIEPDVLGQATFANPSGARVERF